METITLTRMNRKSKAITPNVPHITIPPILTEYFQDGVRMYKCENDRLFIADTYDRTFKVTRGQIKPKHYRDNETGKPKQFKGI